VGEIEKSEDPEIEALWLKMLKLYATLHQDIPDQFHLNLLYLNEKVITREEFQNRHSVLTRERAILANLEPDL
jgi:BMFP domain-containing protein YqiC